MSLISSNSFIEWGDNIAGFNFEQIGGIVSKYMDTDLMDISRKTTIVNPDGSSGEETPANPVYKNVPCHIVFTTPDNPDVNTVDLPPIIVDLTIHCPLNVDLQNNDYVHAHKCGSDGRIIETYSGTVGFHTVSQSRQSVKMMMRRDV